MNRVVTILVKDGVRNGKELTLLFGCRTDGDGTYGSCLGYVMMARMHQLELLLFYSPRPQLMRYECLGRVEVIFYKVGRYSGLRTCECPQKVAVRSQP